MAILRWMGAPESEVKMVEAMYENAKARVVVGSCMSNEFQVNIGVRQGSALGPLLFILVKRVCFYIAQYPVRWTAQSALHVSSPGRPVHSDTNSASLGSILAMQQLRNDYSLTCPL